MQNSSSPSALSKITPAVHSSAKPLPANAFFASPVGSADCFRCARPRPDLESKSGLACYLFNSLVFNNIVGSFSPFPGPSSGSVTLAFHRRFSIAERVPRRETDETFETHFPPSAPVGRSAVFGGFAGRRQRSFTAP